MGASSFIPYLIKYLVIAADKVIETVENELSKQKQFSGDDIGRYLEFDCARHLRLLARSGFLEVVSEKGEKVLKYSRLGTWPPHSDFFGGAPIGVAYYEAAKDPYLTIQIPRRGSDGESPLQGVEVEGVD